MVPLNKRNLDPHAVVTSNNFGFQAFFRRAIICGTSRTGHNPGYVPTMMHLFIVFLSIMRFFEVSASGLFDNARARVCVRVRTKNCIINVSV